MDTMDTMDTKKISEKLDEIIRRFSVEERTFISLDEIFFDSSGHIFKQSLNQFGKRVWTVLSNQNKEWGWYFVDSPYVDTCRANDDGSKAVQPIEPNENKLKTYSIHSKYISYFINDLNQIVLFVYTLKDGLLAFVALHQKPTWQNLCHTTYEEWVNEYNSSQPLNSLPLINPQSFGENCSSNWNQEEWTEDLSYDDWTEGVEYRQDFDGNWYTKDQFYDYYGSFIQWGFQHPLNICRRFLLLDFIKAENNPEIVNSLIDKLVSI